MEGKSAKSFNRCAHYASLYLPLTENWIYRIIINHQQYTPIFLSRKKNNLSLFPIERLYSLDNFSAIRQYFEILLFKVLGYFIFFKKVCEQHKIEILHVHFGYHGAKSVGLKKKLNIPMICSFYGDDAFADRYQGRYEKLFKEADKILVLGPYMKRKLVSIGCPENKIDIHHLGIDVDTITYTNRKVSSGSNIKLLIASSFVEKKGIDLAIKALSKFKSHNFTLDIVGDGPLRDTILHEIEKSGLADRITLHGYKPYDFLINLMYTCDVFIQASRTTKENNKEGTPMVIVDAMATGMAVIATKHSDIPEVVIDTETGYLAEENNLESLEQCIAKLFDDVTKIELFSLNGRARAEKEFNARTQTLRLEKYYSELIVKYQS